MTDEKLRSLEERTIAMQELFSDVENTENELRREYDEANDAQNDLLHYLEFENLSASDMAKAASALRSLRRRRRKIKNMWMTFQAMDKKNNLTKGGAFAIMGTTWEAKPYNVRTEILKDTFGDTTERFSWAAYGVGSKKEK